MNIPKWAMFFIIIVVELNLVSLTSGNNNFVFEVKHKFKREEVFRNISAYKAHDTRRHSRLLTAIDLPLGGNGNAAEAGLYYAKIGIGSPLKDYYVQVDTGSDLLWVNSIECEKCPTKSDLGVKLTLYDAKSSSTAKNVYCGDEFCASTYDYKIKGCTKDILCQYSVVYGDGSSTAGYFVNDTVSFLEVSGNMQTSIGNASVVFGCGATQAGELGSSSEALDGIMGFGQASSSMISQLASAGQVKKMFAHCLDNVNGGGIFAIGNIVAPKFNSTPIVPNQTHYNVILQDIKVGADSLPLPLQIFETGNEQGTIIDSGTTLAYLPEVVYESMMAKILATQPTLSLHTVDEQFTCFRFSDNVDDGFPVVKFLFQGSLSLTVYPHEYLFQIREDLWCFGWQNGAMQSKDATYMTLLGDLVLSNKLVLYDLENQVIGWTEYDCSSSIKVKDENRKSEYDVGQHNISSDSSLISGRFVTFLLLLCSIFHRLA